MIVNIKRKEFLEQARKAARVISSDPLQKVLSGFLIEVSEKTGTMRLTATNMEASIKVTMPASVEQDGKAVIDAKLFLDLLSKFSGEEVYMELVRESYLIMKSDTAHFEIAVIKDKYPDVEIPMPGETVSVTGLKALVSRTAPAAESSGKDKTVYHCVNLVLSNTGLSAVSTNGYYLVQANGDRDCKGNMSMLVPASSLRTFASIAQDSDVYELGVTGTGGVAKSIVLYDGSTLFSARLIEGKFVDYKQFFKTFNAATTFVINSADFRTGLSGISATATSGDSVGITMTSSGLRLSCDGKNGTATTVVQALLPNADGQCRYYSMASLQSSTKALSGDMTLSLSADGTLMVSDGQTKCILVRMRELKKVAKKETAKAAA